ncbi:MAG TPA: hypothetical protein VFB31_14755 [Pseudolabrys sp.]|nr:hypothetical protein [Pseudolabrys sp.]
MMPRYEKAVVKFNGGNGALLCNACGIIVRDGIWHDDVEHYCDDCRARRTRNEAAASEA